MPTTSTCRLLFHICQNVENELRKLEVDDIIEEATGLATWFLAIVERPKPKDSDKVGMCVDMHQANTAIEREQFITLHVRSMVNRDPHCVIKAPSTGDLG